MGLHKKAVAECAGTAEAGRCEGPGQPVDGLIDDRQCEGRLVIAVQTIALAVSRLKFRCMGW